MNELFIPILATNRVRYCSIIETVRKKREFALYTATLYNIHIRSRLDQRYRDNIHHFTESRMSCVFVDLERTPEVFSIS
jgi:hypothetical protein